MHSGTSRVKMLCNTGEEAAVATENSYTQRIDHLSKHNNDNGSQVSPCKRREL